MDRQTMINEAGRQRRIDTINTMSELVADDAVNHGLYECYDGMTANKARLQMVMRMAAEVVEAYNAVGNDTEFLSEMADVGLMVLSICGHLGMDIGRAMEQKRVENIDRSMYHMDDRRPYGHGGK